MSPPIDATVWLPKTFPLITTSFSKAFPSPRSPGNISRLFKKKKKCIAKPIFWGIEILRACRRYFLLFSLSRKASQLILPYLGVYYHSYTFLGITDQKPGVTLLTRHSRFFSLPTLCIVLQPAPPILSFPYSWMPSVLFLAFLTCSTFFFSTIPCLL